MSETEDDSRFEYVGSYKVIVMSFEDLEKYGPPDKTFFDGKNFMGVWKSW